MSVNSPADKHLVAARDHVSRAVLDLSEIVIKQCPGQNGWNAEDRATIRASLHKLIEIRDTL